MDKLSLGGQRVNYAGFVVAAVGFVLTRYTVVESVMSGESLGDFVFGPGIFLFVGLGLTLVGVSLAVSTYETKTVNLVAWWTVLGVGSMFLVVVVTAAATMGAPTERETHLVVNVLLGGAVGGLLTGIHSASNLRHQRELARQTDRFTVLNRILRHEVLNKVNVIRGWAGVATDDSAASTDSLSIIDRNAASIDEAIEQVGVITRTSTAEADEQAITIERVIATAVEAVTAAHPEATIDVRGDTNVRVCSSDGLANVFGHLLENAVVHTGTDAPVVTVTVTADGRSVSVSVADDGPGLPADQRALLEERALPEYDDPSVGFGLTIVRLLLEQANGVVDVAEGEAGTTIRVTLPRAGERTRYGVTSSALIRTAASAVVAGVAMAFVLQALTGSIAIVGSLYGVNSATVGWVTHLFHSVTFGLLFAAVCAHPSVGADRRHPAWTVALAVGFGVALWVGAAGVIMPLWLRAVGIAATVPNLSLAGFLGHVVWGTTLGSGLVVMRWLDKRSETT